MRQIGGASAGRITRRSSADRAGPVIEVLLDLKLGRMEAAVEVARLVRIEELTWDQEVICLAGHIRADDDVACLARLS